MVTHKVFNDLKKAYLAVSNNLVGVDHHVHKIMENIGTHTSETRIVGIHGMGGVGKTTIAKLIYNELSNKYKNCCFISNIRETSKLKGIYYLQQQLISDILKMERTNIRNIDEGIEIIRKRLSDKKVLLLLDDVEEKDHINALVGKRDWFGKGSKIIVTTRRKDVLCVLEVDWRYELTCLDLNLSLQLFSKHAFRRDFPKDEYIDQSKRAVHIAGGLPLALEVIGSLLSNKNKEMWDATLKKLESIPDDEVQSKLKISYDALNDWQQHIFLDIACQFIGYHKDTVVYFWDASELFSEVALEVLQDMSLIKIEIDNTLWMHDQLRDIGREIVRQKSKMKIENRCRVWNPKDGLELLKRHEEKKEVEALRLKFDDQHRFTYKDFKSLPYLTFLEVDDLKENFRGEKLLFCLEWLSNCLPTNIFQRNSDLLPRLRWLSWHNIRPTFNIANFSVENLIILDLSRSEITHDWKGWSHMKVIKNLKVLDLGHCERLKRTPNFSDHLNLERLILSDCESLIEIDGSISQLKCLVFLDVSDCRNLQRLPDELGRDPASLKYLCLRRCSSLERLPETIGNLESLIELDISRTGIEELPDSIKKSKNLKIVNMEYGCIRKVHHTFWTIEKLEIVKFINGCGWAYGVRKIHGIHGVLQIAGILRIPDFMRKSRIESKRLGKITPKIPMSDYGHVEFDDCIYENKSLRILRLSQVRIHSLPRLPESLIELDLEALLVDTFPDLSNLANLEVLHLGFWPPDCDGKSDGLLEEPIPPWIGNLTKLESLQLRFSGETASWTDLSLPPRPLPRLPSNLSSLYVEGCYSLGSMDLSNLRKLSFLWIWYSAVAEIEGLGCLENLRYLDLLELEQLAMLPDLSKLHELYSIHLYRCSNLVEIQGELPQSLEHLNIRFCESLQKLPDLSSLKGQRNVIIEHCGKLAVEEISRLCSEESIESVEEDDEEDESVEEDDEEDESDEEDDEEDE